LLANFVVSLLKKASIFLKNFINKLHNCSGEQCYGLSTLVGIVGSPWQFFPKSKALLELLHEHSETEAKAEMKNSD